VTRTALQAVVARHQLHATLKAQRFLPLAEQILGRNNKHMAALGWSLHMRHVPNFMRYI